MFYNKDVRRILQGEISARLRNIEEENTLVKAARELLTPTVLREACFHKAKGIPVFAVLCSLLFIPFFAAKTVAKGLQHLPGRWRQGKKDVLYTLLADGRIRWERLVTAAALRAEQLTRTVGCENEPRFFILDDTLKAKRGKAMEFISYLFDHVSGHQILGFQFLVLAYLAGKRLFPLSFCIRVGKHRPADATTEQLGDGRTCAGQRRHNAVNNTKIQQAAALLREAVTQVPASFVLCDSWYTVKTILVTVKELGLTTIGRVKSGRTFFVQGERLTVAQIYHRYARYHMRYLSSVDVRAAAVNAVLPCIGQVRLVFCKDFREVNDGELTESKAVGVIICTDTSLGAAEIIKHYTKRWNIEILFKDLKQHFGFNAEQTRSFDSRSALTAIALLRYLAVATIRYNELSFASSGSVFEKQYAQANAAVISDALWLVFVAIANCCGFKDLEDCDTLDSFCCRITNWLATQSTSAARELCNSET